MFIQPLNNSYFVLLNLTQERIRQNAEKAEKFNYGKVLKATVHNRPLIGVMAVSYTHLDVYKRQQVYREIKEKLGIQVVRMEYKPEDMILQRYVIDEAQKRP